MGGKGAAKGETTHFYGFFSLGALLGSYSEYQRKIPWCFWQEEEERNHFFFYLKYARAFNSS